MGIETVVLLVDQPCLDSLLKMSWKELYIGMEKGSFRQSRPVVDSKLNRLFDIDCEAELLDWMDSVDVNYDSNVRTALQEIPQGDEGVLKLMQWASPGEWSSWEARTYLYLDVALDREITNRQDLYSQSTWEDVMEKLFSLLKNFLSFIF